MRVVTRVSFCLAVSGVLAGTQPAMGDEPSHAQAEVSPSDSSVDWSSEVAQSIKAGDAGGFATRLRGLKEAEIGSVASAVNQVYWEDQAPAFAWIQALTASLNEGGAYVQAASFLNPLDLADDISDLENGVYARWIGQGGHGLQALLEQWAGREDGADRPISVVASLYQAQYVDRFDEYLAWMEKSPLPLKGVLLQNLAPHLERTHFEAMESLIFPHVAEYESFAGAFYILAERRAEEDAMATLTWASNFPRARKYLGVKIEAFGLALNVILREDLDAAEALLKQPSFMALYFPAERVRMTDVKGDWGKMAQWFHDECWVRFIHVALESDPKRAEEASKTLFDPQLLKDYREFFAEYHSNQP